MRFNVFLELFIVSVNSLSPKFSVNNLIKKTTLERQKIIYQHISNNQTVIPYKQARDMLLQHDRIDIYQNGDRSPCHFLKVPNNCYADINKDTHKFNIEHIFPQSKSGHNKNIKSDLYNIFVCDSYLNQQRSNYRFADLSFYNGKFRQLSFLDSSGNNIDPLICDIDTLCAVDSKQKIFIPSPLSRGIISRSIAYLSLRYNIKLEKVIVDKKLISIWNNKYPPRRTEHIRNFWINRFQGNRNLFIDYPELVNFFF